MRVNRFTIPVEGLWMTLLFEYFFEKSTRPTSLGRNIDTAGGNTSPAKRMKILKSLFNSENGELAKIIWQSAEGTVPIEWHSTRRIGLKEHDH